jgi:acyl-CoA synthetase (AMP-forming)/AMP-acid ligase II
MCFSMWPGEKPCTVRSIGDVLERPLQADDSREALVASDRRLTYAQLDAAVEAAAGALHQLGVRRGDVVAVSLPNRSEVVISFHAATRLGAIWLGVNRSLAMPEKRVILEDAEATILITDDGAAHRTIEAEAGLRVVAAGGPGRPWADLVAAGGSYPRPQVGLDDPAGIAYTSGTTGRPKGVVHSHRNLLLPGAVLAESRGFGPSLRRGDCAALTILNLQVTSTLLAAQAGGTQVVMDRTDAVGIAKWVRDERITSWFGVPTMLHDLSTSPEVAPSDLESLLDVWTGGTHLPEGIRDRFEARFGIPVHATYGLTEAPTVVTIEPREARPLTGSSGRVLPHLEVEIVDPSGAVLPPGHAGEITVRAARTGPWAGAWTPMLGYRNPRVTEASPVRDGVLRTGDIGELDGAGHLVVRDRRQAIILRGGANIYPAEVEQVLLRIPGVVGAAVVGIPDDRLGQRVAAAIEVSAGSSIDVEHLAATCREELARYKVPEHWRIRALPRNAMGKVVRPEVEGWFSPADT